MTNQRSQDGSGTLARSLKKHLMTDTNKLQELLSKHSSFTNMLFELIKSLLNSSEVRYHILEKRTKTLESLNDKINRKEVKDIQNDLTDITGIRIILYYQDDVDKIIDVIKSNFDVDNKNSINKAELYNSNEFGYLSTHYVVSLDNKRKELPEWKTFNELKAEIQIRTVLQHSWASISHELTYKKSYEIPKELQRKLFRLAGLFELADEQFLKIRDEHTILKKSIEKISKTSEIEDEEINLLTLKYIFEKKNTVYDKVSTLAVESGFLSNYSDKDDAFLSYIISVSDLLGFKRIKEIETALKPNLEKIKLLFEGLISRSEGKWIGNKPFFNLLAVIYLLDKELMLDFFKHLNWSDTIVKNILETTNEVKSI